MKKSISIIMTMMVFVVLSMNVLAEPIGISDCDGLQAMNNNLSADYILLNNIDCSDTINWNEGRGWTPIGAYEFEGNIFTGSLNGQNYNISDVFMNRSIGEQSIYGLGMFNIINQASFSNFKLINPNIIIDTNDELGSYSVCAIGTLVGWSSNSTIERVGALGGSMVVNDYSCDVAGLVAYVDKGILNQTFYQGEVTASLGQNLGLLTAYIEREAIVRDSYSIGTVTGDEFVGGLTGLLNQDTTLINSYTVSVVNGNNYVYGLIGDAYGSVTNSYWNTDVSGIEANLSTEKGRTTEEMTYPYAVNTYEEWNFDSIWTQDLTGYNNGYPFLSWETTIIEEPVTPPTTSTGGGGGRYLPPTNTTTDETITPTVTPIQQDNNLIRSILLSLFSWIILFGVYKYHIQSDLRRTVRKRKFFIIAGFIVVVSIVWIYLTYLGVV